MNLNINISSNANDHPQNSSRSTAKVRSDEHYLYLQEVMRQRLLVVRKQAIQRWKTTVMRAKQQSVESQVRRGNSSQVRDKLLMKKTLRLMQLHFEKNQKEVVMMAFMKMKHRFEFEPHILLASEPSSSPVKALSPSKTTPRKNKRTGTTKQKAVAKGTKLPSGFTHYLKVEADAAQT